MNTTSHTPGPWTIWQDKDSDGEVFDMPDSHGGRVVQANGEQVASVFHAGANGAANARLIAAAPAMLWALEMAAERIPPGDYLDGMAPEWRQTAEAIQTALAKAKWLRHDPTAIPEAKTT